MKIAKNSLLLAVVLLYSLFGVSQRGKDGSYTSSTANFVLNSATYLTANATTNSTSITVNSNSLTGGFFLGALAQGDLILIMQMQGATMDIDPITSIPLASGGWGGDYTVAASVGPGTDWHLSADIWGRVTNYNQSGKFEQVEVLSVSGTNIINLQCPLKNNYTSAGHVQVIRVPRFQNLTINTGASLVPAAWNGNTGGIVAIEVAGNLVLTGTGKLSATGLGFRGGVADGQGGSSVGGVSMGLAAAGTGIGDTYLASYLRVNGARKGEGIGGYTTEYAALYSVYGRSGAANGGGGAGYQNAGGGGGSNVGTGTYTGKGNPNPTYASFWNLELAGFGASTSSGGGRGGYTLSNSDQNEAIVGPNNTLWGAGYRKPEGGYGGHTLAYDNTRIFMGGGGGAGDQDNLQGGAGGAGGGIAFLTVYGTITGTGSIESNGADGIKSNPTGATPLPGNNKKGTDGAGGAGAGGSIYIQNSSAIPSTIALNAKGGKGGDNAITLGTGITTCTEANGPGGGGAGGSIALTSGTPTQVVTGGANGVVTVSGVSTSSPIANFPMNGATVGGAGISGLTTTIYDLIPRNDTICSGNTASLSVTVTGTMPAGGVVYWYTQQFGGTSIASGTTFVTPVLTATTTYYAGVCPGTFRIPVIAVVKPKPTIAGTAVITNAGCTTLGSITGLSVSGGTSPYTYSWNSITSSSINLTNAAIGTYNLLVTDSKGCTATSGPYTITGSSGPVINSAGVVVTNQSCTGVNGSITGITATGNGLTYNWSNSGGVALNASNLVAGSYTLTVTDNLGCTANSGPYSVTATVGPTLNVAGVVMTATTCGQSNGSITGIIASGSGLTYNWNNGLASTLDLTNQPVGNYTLVVQDANNCITTSSVFTINSSGTLSINSVSVISTDEHCGQGNGSVSGVIVVGGTNPITYSWANTNQTSLNLTGLSAGTYTLTATDGSGCLAVSSPFVINNIAGPSVNSDAIVITNGTCGHSNGAISGITATGLSLTYSWDNGAGTLINASNLPSGTFSLTVSDNFGCSVVSGPYTISSQAGPVLNVGGVVIQPASCGISNGSITGITSIGTGLIYNWNNGLANTLDLTNQPAGNYTLIVTDANNCIATSSVFTINSTGTLSVTSTSTIVVDEHCSQSDGSISGIIISGGTNPIAYSWSNTTQTTLDLTGIASGVYTLTATDGTGCVATSSQFVLNNLAGPTINEGNALVLNESCALNDASISGITSTGVLANWSNNGGSNLNATGLSAGTYTLTVSDAFGCVTSSNPYVINGVVPMVLDLTNFSKIDADCDQNNGSITGLQIVGGLNPQILWSTNSTDLDLSLLAPANYHLIITDNQGCSIDTFILISTKTPPSIDISMLILTGSHCGSANGSVTGIKVTGGTPDYFYKWNNNSGLNTLDLINKPAGIYDLLVTDNAGCTDSKQIEITEINGPSIDEGVIDITQISCSNLGSITNLSVSGVGPFTYQWSNNVTSANNTNLTEGNYSVIVTDAFGCQVTSSTFTLTQTDKPIADFYWNPYMPSVGSDVHFNNSSINAVSYSWSFGDGTTSNEFEPNHVYTDELIKQYSMFLIATSTSGCVDTAFYTIIMNDDLIYYVPNSFTPNSDQFNNVFQPIFTQGIDTYDFSFLVYNRWGEVVFESKDSSKGWDGTYNGIVQQDGTYTWKISFKMSQTDERKVAVGYLNLIK